MNRSQLEQGWTDAIDRLGLDARIVAAADGWPETRSVTVDWWDIQHGNELFADELLVRPESALAAGETVLRRRIPADSPARLRLKLTNLPAQNELGIREIRAEHLGKLVSVVGLIRQAHEVRPQILDARFECLRCHAEMRVWQMDPQLREPMCCEKDDPQVYVGEPGCGRLASATEFRLIADKSAFRDVQSIELQERPEGLRGGEQPQNISCVLDGDNVGRVYPGGRCRIIGILEPLQRKSQGVRSTMFDVVLVAVGIEPLDVDGLELDISEEDRADIQALAADPAIYDRLRASICPSVWGLDDVKDALVLQLYGGVSKDAAGSSIRGDIHILLVGDPGTAKSQLLEYQLRLAPRAMKVSGKSASGVGLTASVTKDESPLGGGRWVLQAGAMVLADKGLCCIDELDKMSREDRSSMHEAMEQQRISVAKAGITATLQARCCVLAAANPKGGRFDRDNYTSLSEQVALPPTLLSRFDAIFMILDKPDMDRDGALADHVLANHKDGTRAQPIDGLPTDVIRKYCAVAKDVQPKLTGPAMDKIKKTYLARRIGTEGAAGVTARHLEAYIRLAEASARIRLSQTVEVQDVDRAVRVIDAYVRSSATGSDGKVDLDIISGVSTSARHVRSAVKDLVAMLYRDTGTDPDLDTILDNGRLRGLTDDKVRDAIEKLENAGEIYSPRPGLYRVLGVQT